MSDKKAAGFVAFPDISALGETTKDWEFSGGVYHPKIQSTWGLDFSGFQWGGVTQFLYGGIGSPVVAATPPLPLPTEKRDMPVIGFRAWGFSSRFKIGVGRDVALKSTGNHIHWSQGDNHAACTQGGSHKAPDERCTCGFYVLASLDEVETHATLNDGVVVGAVMGWGKVVQHGTEGWRAEHAKIVGLLDCKFSKGQSKNTEAAAMAYNIEIYSRSAIESYLREWGDPFQAK